MTDGQKTIHALTLQAKIAWDRGDGWTYSKLRGEIGRLEGTAFSSLHTQNHIDKN
jgi:hypothetical protein